MAEDEEIERSNNARLFRIAVSNSLKNIAESVSEDEFLKTLTLLKSNPGTVQKLHKAMIKELYDSMNNDLEDIMKEGSLQDALIKIDRLSEESITSSDENRWRPPGNIISHLRSLDAHKTKEAIEHLEEQVNNIEKENHALMKMISEGRSKIHATSDSMIEILDRAPSVLERLEKTYEQLANCLKIIESE